MPSVPVNFGLGGASLGDIGVSLADWFLVRNAVMIKPNQQPNNKMAEENKSAGSIKIFTKGVMKNNRANKVITADSLRIMVRSL